MGWQNFMIAATDPTLLAGLKPFQVDLTSLPAEVNLSPARIAGYVALGIAAVYAAGMFAAYLDNQPLIGNKRFVALAALVPLVLLLICGWSVLTTQRTALFGRLDVAVTEPDGSQWRTKYEEMLGIRHHEIVRHGRYDATRFQIIELVHGDGVKVLPLYVRGGTWSGQSQLEAYAQLLRVPVIETRRDVREYQGKR